MFGFGSKKESSYVIRDLDNDSFLVVGSFGLYEADLSEATRFSSRDQAASIVYSGGLPKSSNHYEISNWY